MTRPLAIDLWNVFFPLVIGAAAFGTGMWSWRWPRTARNGLIVLAVTGAAVVGASAAGMLSPAADRTMSLIGSAPVLLCWMTLILLGLVWAVPTRRWSSRFLAFLVGVAGFLILIDAGACLWWRFGASDLWENTANAGGGVRQSTGLTCYPASAAMLLHHYGISATECEMAYLGNTTPFGSDAHSMARALTLKLLSRGWRAEMEATNYVTLVRRGDPFIAHVDPPDVGSHAIFVQQAGPEFVEVIDPLDGARRRMSRADFEAVWDGTLVRVKRSE
jgi:hypothetical protein